MDNKHWCSCGGLHWDDEDCPSQLIGWVQAACRQLGVARVREIADQHEADRIKEREEARRKQEEFELKRKQAQLEEARRTVERLEKEGIK